MSEQRVLLDTAAFLDSAHAVRLDVLPTADVRTVVGRFLEACYLDLGKAPRLLQGDDLEQVLTELLPRRFGIKDALAPPTPTVLAAYLEFLGESAVVTAMYELRTALDQWGDAFCQVVARGAAHATGSGLVGKGKTIVHRAERTGRNDPCPCGSGKKFKKCCMRLGDG